MELRQLVRGKMTIGFSNRRNPQGEIEGCGILRLTRRNAYELVGLRRPVRAHDLRMRVC